MNAPHPLNTIKVADPALFDRINSSREFAFQEGEISAKNKYLIALAIDTVEHAEGGIRSLATQALAHGATKQEIIETLRIVHYICGGGAMYVAAEALKDIL